MDLIGEEPILNMGDTTFRIFSRNAARPPQHLGRESKIVNSLVSEGCRINGRVENSILSGGVIIEDGAVVKDSVIMEDVVIKSGASVYSSIVDSGVSIECGAVVGTENAGKQDITVIAKNTVINK